MRQRNDIRPDFPAGGSAGPDFDVADRIYRVREWRARYLARYLAAAARTIVHGAVRRLAGLLHRGLPATRRPARPFGDCR